MKKIKTLILPFLVAVGLFSIIRPTFAQVLEKQARLSEYISVNDVEVGIEVADGYSQVYYLFEGERTFVNKNNQNKRHPYARGEYIVWAGDINGAGQIYRYHVPTDSVVQVTNSSTNLQPKVSREGKVVWERWVEDRWQVFFFDGVATKQLTTGDVSVGPEIEGDNILFASQDATGTWKATLYIISENKMVDVAIGFGAKFPRFEGDRIVFGPVGKGKEFPLTVEDLKILDLPPLSTPSAELAEPVEQSEEEISQEIESNIEGTPDTELEP